MAGWRDNRVGFALQIVALIFAMAAIVLGGGFVVWSTAFPPICGDSSGAMALGLVACWIVDLPIGLLVLAIGCFVKSGTRLLRKICIGASLLTLSLPVAASIIFQTWHCR
jgi:hypothetical protein